MMDYVEQNSGGVTYEVGAKGRIVGQGTPNVEGVHKLKMEMVSFVLSLVLVCKLDLLFLVIILT